MEESAAQENPVSPKPEKPRGQTVNEYKELLRALDSALGQMEDIKKMPQADEALASKIEELQQCISDERSRIATNLDFFKVGPNGRARFVVRKKNLNEKG